MTPPQDDPILEACLEEILGGRRPPDLTARILTAYREADEVGPHPAVELSRVEVSDAPGRAAPRRHTHPAWIPAAIMAGIVLGGTSLGLVALRWTEPVAEPPAPSPSGVPAPVIVAESEPPPAAPLISAEPLRDVGPSPEAPPAFARTPAVDPLRALGPTPTAPASLAFDEVVGLIDGGIRAAWRAHDLEPAPPLSAAAWCQTVFEQLLGRRPTPAEAAASEASPQRRELIRRLCFAPEFREAFARHWADNLTPALAPQRLKAAGRQELRQFIQASLEERTPLTGLAAALLVRPAGYWSFGRDPQGFEWTAHAGRALFATRLRCARCHDHPTAAQLTQRQFWELNALHRQLRGAGPASGEQAVFFDTPQGQVKAAYPSLLGTPLRTTSADGVEEVVAEQLAQHQQFQQAMVNRVWSLLFGYGLSEQVDDLGSAIWHRELLTGLSQQLTAHNSDLNTLVAWIAASEPFSLGMAASSKDRPQQGGPALFSGRYSAPQPAPLAALLAAAGKAVPSPAAATTARLAPLGPAAAESLAAPAEVPPLSAVFSARSLHAGPRPVVERILRSRLTTDDKLDHLFWELLDRSPTNSERRLVKELLARAPAARSAWLDTWWAVRQSGEFSAMSR